MFDFIAALILVVAVDVGIPPNFALAIAYEENSRLDPLIVSVPNGNGSRDYGVFQLNGDYIASFVKDYWDKDWEFDWSNPYDNVYLACRHIKYLSNISRVTTWWAVALCYNAGYSRLVGPRGPPKSAVEYAGRVMEGWQRLEGRNYICPVIIGEKK